MIYQPHECHRRFGSLGFHLQILGSHLRKTPLAGMNHEILGDPHVLAYYKPPYNWVVDVVESPMGPNWSTAHLNQLS